MALGGPGAGETRDMSYEVRLRGSTVKDLRQLAPPQADLILVRILDLANDPKPRASTDLSGALHGLRRLRVGDYRVAYMIDESAKSIEVWKVSHRRDFYKRLDRQW